MIKRLFDFLSSLLGLILLLPLFLIIALLILFDSRGEIFYRQSRVGKMGSDFVLFKFRTMKSGADKQGLLTVGSKDHRITSIGFYLRKYKLDELPQLFNVLKGEMSLVGPRPEVRKYVEFYNEEQKKILEVKPGITDYASIEYVNESDLLAAAVDPDELYVKKIMPAKINLNIKYIREKGLLTDIKIIVRTLGKIFI